MVFKMTFRDGGDKVELIDRCPWWLESWFWNDYVLTLAVGESVNTDFRTISRVS